LLIISRCPMLALGSLGRMVGLTRSALGIGRVEGRGVKVYFKYKKPFFLWLKILNYESSILDNLGFQGFRINFISKNA